jgi:methyl-accepting chemotaxis protein
MTELDTAPVNGTAPSRTRKTTRSAASAEPTAVLDALPTRVLLADKDGVISYANPASIEGLRALADWLPVAFDEIIGSSLDVITPEMLAGDLPYLGSVTIGAAVLELHVVGSYDEAGEVASYSVTWENATARREAANEVARITSMMENSPTNMMFADREFVITYMNPASLPA